MVVYKVPQNSKKVSWPKYWDQITAYGSSEMEFVSGMINSADFSSSVPLNSFANDHLQYLHDLRQFFEWSRICSNPRVLKRIFCK